VVAVWWRCGGGVVAVWWRCGGGVVAATSVILDLDQCVVPTAWVVEQPGCVNQVEPAGPLLAVMPFTVAVQLS
jgi:hypothetical protein